MRPMTRRQMVVGGGAAAGLTAALTPGPVLGQPAPAGDPPPADVLRQLRVAAADLPDFLARAGGGTPAVPLPPAAPTRPAVGTDGRVLAHTDADGRVFARGLSFLCDPRVVNRLTVGGAPLTARLFSFTAHQVRWAAGPGLPVYDRFCPRFDARPGGRYPGAKWHQVVPLVEGGGYFAGCVDGAVCEADTAGPVAFDVNAADYDAHRGLYAVTVWGWA